MVDDRTGVYQSSSWVTAGQASTSQSVMVDGRTGTIPSQLQYHTRGVGVRPVPWGAVHPLPNACRCMVPGIWRHMAPGSWHMAPYGAKPTAYGAKPTPIWRHSHMAPTIWRHGAIWRQRVIWRHMAPLTYQMAPADISPCSRARSVHELFVRVSFVCLFSTRAERSSSSTSSWRT